jgi:hypothetical protein
VNEDKKGDWCIVSLDRFIIGVKIVHKSRGIYKIIEDTKNGIHVDRIVDASDIIQVEKST